MAKGDKSKKQELSDRLNDLLGYDGTRRKNFQKLGLIELVELYADFQTTNTVDVITKNLRRAAGLDVPQGPPGTQPRGDGRPHLINMSQIGTGENLRRLLPGAKRTLETLELVAETTQKPDPKP